MYLAMVHLINGQWNWNKQKRHNFKKIVKCSLSFIKILLLYRICTIKEIVRTNYSFL